MKIKFTFGTIWKKSDYFTAELLNNGRRVYIGMISDKQAKLLLQTGKVKLINE